MKKPQITAGLKKLSNPQYYDEMLISIHDFKEDELALCVTKPGRISVVQTMRKEEL